MTHVRPLLKESNHILDGNSWIHHLRKLYYYVVIVYTRVQLLSWLLFIRIMSSDQIVTHLIRLDGLG